VADTGWQFPGTGANSTVIGTIGWTNAGNILSDNGSNAGCTSGSPGTTNYLRGSNFGFSALVPAGATIDGIEARAERARSAGGNANDTSIRLFDANATVAGDNKSTSDAWGTLEVFTYGGATDLWGLTPTQADVSDTDWGFGIAAVFGAGGSTVICDYLQMKIYYTEAAPAGPTVGSLALMGMGR
jgi:hypothetical protein